LATQVLPTQVLATHYRKNPTGPFSQQNAQQNSFEIPDKSSLSFLSVKQAVFVNTGLGLFGWMLRALKIAKAILHPRIVDES